MSQAMAPNRSRLDGHATGGVDAGGDSGGNRPDARQGVSSRSAFRVLLPFALLLATSWAKPAAAVECAGDCGGVGRVTAADLVLMVRIMAGAGELSACPAADADEDGAVTAADLERALPNFFGGCDPPLAYETLVGELHHVVYPTRGIDLDVAAALVAALDAAGVTDEAELRALVEQFLTEQGVGAERIAAIEIFAQRQDQDCDDCLATCTGRCVQNPQGQCFCYERLPTDPARSIAVFLLERAEDEEIAFDAVRRPCFDALLHAGAGDAFSAANGAEPSVPSAGLASLIQQGTGQPPAGFDQGAIDRVFGQTFTLPQGKCLAAATLVLRARPISGNPGPGSRNDTLRLGFVNPGGQFVGAQWAAYFGTGNAGLPLLFGVPWLPSNFPAPNGALLVLNLGALPGGGTLLADLETRRFLDVLVQDDSSVDYVDLIYRLCDCPNPTPTPTATPSRTATSTPAPSATPTTGICEIAICKQSIPTGGTGFPFSSGFSGLQGISVDDGLCIVRPLACGPIFDVFEVPQSTSTLSNIACSFLSGSGTFSIIGATVGATAGFEPGDSQILFSLSPGAFLECLFTNTLHATPTGTSTSLPSATATRTATATPQPTASATPAVTGTCVAPPASLVAWWPLDEAPAATTVLEIGQPPANSGVPQPGPVQPFPPGGTGPAAVPGNLVTTPADGALYHFTQSTYVAVPHAAELDLAAADLTVDAWVRPLPGPWTAGRDSLHAYTVVDKLDLANNTGYAFYVQVRVSCPTCPPPPQQPPASGSASMMEMRLAFALGTGSGVVVVTSAPFYSGSGSVFPFPTPPSPLVPQPPSWTHVAVAVDRSQAIGRFHLNGSHMAGSDFVPATALGNTAPLWLGGTRLYGTPHAPSFTEFTLNEIEVFDEALSSAELQAIASASGGKCKGTPIPTRTPTPTVTPPCIPPPSDMVAWWTGDNTAADLAGGGHHGAFFQGPGTYTGGVVGAAFDFPTIPDFVQANHVNFSGNFSIDAWIRTTNTGLAAIVDSRHNAGSTPKGYYLFVFGGALGFELGDGQPQLWHVSPGPIISDGAWHHVAATVDRTSTTGGRLYVDGVPVHTFDPTTRPGSIASLFPVRLGQAWISAIGFQGAIDEVELFDRELLAQEVQAVYQAGARGKCKTPLPSRTPTPTITPTPTGTIPASFTASPTATPRPSNTPVPTSTASATRTPSVTRTSTATRSATRTATSSVTRTATRTATATRTVTNTSPPSPTATLTATPTLTATRTATGTITQTRTATLTGTQTGTATITRTPTETRTRTSTATRTDTGTITRTATRTPTPPCFAELCVLKFDDQDGDGMQDPGEPGLAGWTIHVVDQAMNVVASPVTGAQGVTCIGVPAPAIYTASEVPQSGWTQTFPPPPGSHFFGIECGQLVNLAFGNVSNATRTPTRTATRTPNVLPVD